MLSRLVVRKSKSSYCASPVVVPKPDGSMRFCTNFRYLNAVTEKDKYPMDRMEDLFDKLRGSFYFTDIDLKSAY